MPTLFRDGGGAIFFLFLGSRLLLPISTYLYLITLFDQMKTPRVGIIGSATLLLTFFWRQHQQRELIPSPVFHALETLETEIISLLPLELPDERACNSRSDGGYRQPNERTSSDFHFLPLVCFSSFGFGVLSCILTTILPPRSLTFP